MVPKVLIFLALILVSFGQMYSLASDYEKAFLSFVSENNKNYPNVEEKTFRFNVFKKNLD